MILFKTLILTVKIGLWVIKI